MTGLLNPGAPGPDVAAAAVMLVIALRVGDEQALHHPADRVLCGPDEEMEMIPHQAIAIQLERLPLPQVQQSGEQREPGDTQLGSPGTPS